MRTYKETSIEEYERALQKAAEYIERDAMGCPANYDRTLKRDKCLTCMGELISNYEEDYQRDLSLMCWREVFLND